MGTGIMAAVPIEFTPDSRDMDDFAKGFFDNYSIQEIDGKKRHVIHEDILINNYIPFLLEFYELIEVDMERNLELPPSEIPVAKSLEEFKKAFEKSIGYGPFLEHTYLGAIGVGSGLYWLFYFGTYKTDMEDYDTLLHFDKILAKAMSNPLGKSVKFGIYG